MKILSCDLSLTGSAFALLEIQGGHLISVETFLVDNSKNTHMGVGHRLERIAVTLEEIIVNNKDIDHVVIERGFSRFNNVTQALFRVVGVVEMTLSKYGFMDVEFIAPTSIKKTITGNGKASKKDVEKAVRKYLPKKQKKVKFESDDCSDAVAVGISWAIEKEFIKKL